MRSTRFGSDATQIITPVSDFQIDYDYVENANKKYIFVDLGARKGHTLELYYHTQYGRLEFNNISSENFEFYGFEIDKAFKPYLNEFGLNHTTNGTQIIIGAATSYKEKYLTMFLDGLGTRILTNKDEIERICKPNSNFDVSMSDKNVNLIQFSNTHCSAIRNINFASFMYENMNKNDYIAIKIDIEGAEFDLLDSLIFNNQYNINFLTWIDQLSIEWHHYKQDHTTLIYDLLVRRTMLKKAFVKYGLTFMYATHPIDGVSTKRLHTDWSWSNMHLELNGYGAVFDEHWWRLG